MDVPGHFELVIDPKSRRELFQPAALRAVAKDQQAIGRPGSRRKGPQQQGQILLGVHSPDCDKPPRRSVRTALLLQRSDV